MMEFFGKLLATRVMTALMREIEKQAGLLSVEERELQAERLPATASARH